MGKYYFFIYICISVILFTEWTLLVVLLACAALWNTEIIVSMIVNHVCNDYFILQSSMWAVWNIVFFPFLRKRNKNYLFLGQQK